MDATVVKTMTFSAAHSLPDYDGPCNRLHGHNWDVQVGIRGPINPQTGMVVDFKWVKAPLTEIFEPLDHHLLNETLDNPTAENLAVYIFDRLVYQAPLQVAFVRVFEGDDSYAEVSG